jgi:hypothetical protein
MKKLAMLVVGMAFVASSAFAFHCPTHFKEIDAALASGKVTGAKLDEAKKLRADGEALHKAGKHQESLDALHKSMTILGLTIVK